MARPCREAADATGRRLSRGSGGRMLSTRHCSRPPHTTRVPESLPSTGCDAHPTCATDRSTRTVGPFGPAMSYPRRSRTLSLRRFHACRFHPIGPASPSAGSRTVQDLADDRLGQSTRVQPVIPLGVGRELVRDEPAEWSGIEVLRMPGRQPQAGQVIAPCPPRSTSPPVSFVDHRVPPVACLVRTARAGRSLSERRHEPGPDTSDSPSARDRAGTRPGTRGAFGGNAMTGCRVNVVPGFRQVHGTGVCDQWGSACE